MTIIQNTLPMLDYASSRALLHFSEIELQIRANSLREKAFDNEIKLCSIINIKSGNCSMDCAFCSQNINSVAPLKKYPMLDIKLLESRIRQLARLPVKNIGLVASGPVLAGREFEALCLFLESLPPDIKKKICVSLGKLKKEQILALKKAGIRHCHHNLETSEKFYKNICSTQEWKERLETVHNMLDCGMEVCCGGIFGVGEGWFDRMELALLLGRTGITNIPINFLDPRPGTRMASQKKLSFMEALKIIAFFRNILPESTIRICGGRNIFGDKTEEAIFHGANAIMTGDFLTTRGNSINSDQDLLKRHKFRISNL